MELPSSYGNMVVATTNLKDGRKQRTGISLAATNSLGPIVPPVQQNVFGKRLSASSNDVNMPRRPGWFVCVLQMRHQHIMLCFSPLFTKVRSYMLLLKILIWENSIDATLVSRFRGRRRVIHFPGQVTLFFFDMHISYPCYPWHAESSGLRPPDVVISHSDLPPVGDEGRSSCGVGKSSQNPENRFGRGDNRRSHEANSVYR